MKLKPFEELNLLPENPFKSKKTNNDEYSLFLKKNKENIILQDQIKNIRNVTKTWYIYQKLSTVIMSWESIDLDWIIKVKEIIKENPKLLNVEYKNFYKFWKQKNNLETEFKITKLPEKEIVCSKHLNLKFERNDDYEIIF